MQAFTMQSSRGRATLFFTAVLVIVAIAFNVVDNIEHYESTKIIPQVMKHVLGITLLAVGLGLTGSGLFVMRRARWLGAVLVLGGIWTLAVMVFWLIVPLLVAAAVTAFIVMRAANDQPSL
jgi:hypothetical protein